MQSRLTSKSTLMRVKRTDWLQLIGFDPNSLKRFTDVVTLLNRPEDPASLALFRIAFGILMMIDIPHERAFSFVDHVYGKNMDTCRFPLFNFLAPLPALYMSCLYTVMLAGALGLTLGFMYRLSALMFTVPYWYIFLLDKTVWNNHSYLYGLIGIMFCVFDAHHFCSVDGMLNPQIRDAHVPLWQYFVLRTQIFFVYFIAGLKKTEYDWLAGYSFLDLGEHWVFAPFRIFLPTEYVSWWVIHWSGFLIDLFVGFFLFFDCTRRVGTVVVSMFHTMNSQIFKIGVFPYTMLTSTAIFYSNSWPRNVLMYWKGLKPGDPFTRECISGSLRCLYDKPAIISTNRERDAVVSLSQTPTKATLRHNICAVLSITYIVSQFILPYSHCITKGYNGWTDGLYGYSWDMMVHSWRTQYIKLQVKNPKTGEEQLLDSSAFTPANRWSSHPDMIKQFATCVGRYAIDEYQWPDVEVRLDIWRSMNDRFSQRQVNPDVDLYAADWSPFKTPTWMIGLISGLSGWRNTLRRYEKEMEKRDEDTELTFVADLKGMSLRNFIPGELTAVLTVLGGRVKVEYRAKQPSTTKLLYMDSSSSEVVVPSDRYHTVLTVSDQPSCYMYAFVNNTESALRQVYAAYLNKTVRMLNSSHGILVTLHNKRPNMVRGNRSALTINWGRMREKLLSAKMRRIVASVDMQELMRYKILNVTDDQYERVVRRIVVDSLDHEIDAVRRERSFLPLTVARQVLGFFRSKFKIYRRTGYIIIFTIRCLVTGESLGKLMFDRHDSVNDV